MDFIDRLNHQRSILHPSVIDKAIHHIKSKLSTQQFIALINGAQHTQQSVAEETVTQIAHTLKTINENRTGSTTPKKRRNDSTNNTFESKSDSYRNDDDIDIEMYDSLDDESTVSCHESLTLSLNLELTQYIDEHDTITSLYILQNKAFSQCILDFLDDISISIYSQINKECHQLSKHINQYKYINTNQWLFEYVMQGQYTIKHMIHCKEIILDFTNFDDELYQDFLIKTFDGMQRHNIFAECCSLSIISPSTEISRILSECIGSLTYTKELILKDIEIFPMIKIISQIPSNFSMRLSMIDIDIKRESDDENDIIYSDNDEWMKRNIDINCIQSFIERLLECKYIAICGWKNDYVFWHKMLKEIHNTLDCNQNSKLSDTLPLLLKMCPIKELVYLPSDPMQDRIPHIWFKFMLKYKGHQIERLKVNFASCSNLYHAVYKSLKPNLKMNALEELYFGWNDRSSYKFLNSVNGKNLQTVKLWLPGSRSLCKQEQKVIAAIKRKCNNVHELKGWMCSM